MELAGKIASGDLSLDIPPRSDNDELGRSFYTMTTSLRSAAEKLTKSKNKFRSLFEHMTNGFALHKVVLDENNKPVDYVFLEINKAFTEHTGLTEEIIGKNVTKVLPGIKKNETDFIGIFSNMALTGIPEQFETYFAPLEKWLSVTAYSPQKYYFVSVYENITDRKKLHEQLFQAQKTESIGRLAGGIAHDFTNILVGIMGYAELLNIKFNGSNSSEAEAAGVILQGAKRAADLTKQLLGFARAGKFNPVPVDINKFIKETVKVSEKIFEKKIKA